MSENLKTYKVPPRFYHDHRSRDLPEQGISSVVSENQRAVFVEMDQDAFADLMSDTEYYTDPVTAQQMREMGLGGLVHSARATRKALLAQGPVEGSACGAEFWTPTGKHGVCAQPFGHGGPHRG